MHEEHYTVQRPTYETVMRDTSYDVVRNIVETSEREERYMVQKPVCETSMREERYVVQRPVTETAYQPQVRTVMRPVTQCNTRYVDQGCYVDQVACTPAMQTLPGSGLGSGARKSSIHLPASFKHSVAVWPGRAATCRRSKSCSAYGGRTSWHNNSTP